MQVAAQVLLLDELRQPSGARQLDLALRLAQLGRDPVEPQRAVDLLFSTARNDPGVAGDDGARAGPGVSAALAGQAVLVEGQALVVGDAAQLDVVRLAAGEVEQRRAEGAGRHEAQVHLQAVGEAHRGLGVAAGQHLGHALVAGEGRHDARGIATGGQQIEVAHGVAAAPERAGQLDALHPGHGAQRRGQLVGDLPGPGQEHPPGGLPGDLQRAQHVLLGLLAEARQVA